MSNDDTPAEPAPFQEMRRRQLDVATAIAQQLRILEQQELAALRMAQVTEKISNQQSKE